MQQVTRRGCCQSSTQKAFQLHDQPERQRETRMSLKKAARQRTPQTRKRGRLIRALCMPSRMKAEASSAAAWKLRRMTAEERPCGRLQKKQVFPGFEHMS